MLKVNKSYDVLASNDNKSNGEVVGFNINGNNNEIAIKPENQKAKNCLTFKKHLSSKTCQDMQIHPISTLKKPDQTY